VCYTRGVHCTIIATGQLYCYDDDHQMGSGRGFTESDEANFTGTFYTRMRIALEKLLVNFPNVLVVRPVYPISDDLFPRSVIAKVIKYPRVHGIPTSFTILDDLWPVLIDMPARNLTGIYNFTNPGTTDNITILSLYKKYIDPSLTWNAMSKDEEAAAAKGRPFSELDMTKLLKDYPSLPHISTALVSLFERMKAKGIGQGTM